MKIHEKTLNQLEKTGSTCQEQLHTTERIIEELKSLKARSLEAIAGFPISAQQIVNYKNKGINEKYISLENWKILSDLVKSRSDDNPEGPIIEITPAKAKVIILKYPERRSYRVRDFEIGLDLPNIDFDTNKQLKIPSE